MAFGSPDSMEIGMRHNRRASHATTAAAAIVLAVLTAAACGPTISADAPVVTYYYIPG